VPFLFSFRRYSARFRAPVRTAHGWWTEREGLILKLTDAEGFSGISEAAPLPWFGTESADEAAAAALALGEKVEENAIEPFPSSLGCFRGAWARALAEVQARKRFASSGETGVDSRVPYLPVAALLPAGKPALGKIRTLSESGFRSFKWKVGVADAADELGLLDDLLSLLPTGTKLRLDANGAWNRRQAELWLARAADRPIEFIEQPISPSERNAEDLLLGLAQEYPTAIALDESIATDAQVVHWLDLEWPGIFVIKPSLLENATGIVQRLEARKAPIVFSSALETAVGARDALNLALRHSTQGRAIGFGVWPLFEDGRFDGPHLAPFLRRQDVDTMETEAVWNALS
jgi:o-succinylbenzoate synthase